MKVLLAPDLHCYHANYDRVGEDGISSRLSDWQRSAKYLIELAIAQDVQLALFPGDMFNNSRPPMRAIIEVAKLFECLEDEGIAVLACQGNHDAAAPGQLGPVHVLEQMRFSTGSSWGVTQPRFYVHRDVQIAIIPWVKPGVLLDSEETPADVYAACREKLLAIARGYAAQVNPEVPSILMGHWAIDGCTTSSGMSLLGGTETTLPLGDLQALPFSAVVMGHIHRPQVFPRPAGAPLVLHTGAMERLDFGEERDPRGCYVYDTETGEAEWFDLPARRFVTLKPHATLTDSTIQEAFQPFLAGARQQVRDAIVRVTYKAPEETVRRGDHGAVIRLLEDAGAHLVAGVFPEVLREERRRDASITEDTGPEAALERWLQQRPDLSDELRAKVLDAGRTLIGEVA